MTRLALCLLLLAPMAGCQPECWSSDPEQCRLEREQIRLNANREKMASHFQGSDLNPLVTRMNVYRDSVNGVTCWSLGKNTLSCLPDWMLRKPTQASSDAVLAPSPHEQQPEPTPALAPGRWIDERYEL